MEFTNRFSAETLLKVVPSDEELYQEYSAQEYIAFCLKIEALIQRTESGIREQYQKSQTFRQDIELWPKKYKDFRNKVFHEMKPLRFFIEHFAQVKNVKYESNEKSYDAYIRTDLELEKIEITTAVDHRLYELAMEGLAQDPVVHVSINALEHPKVRGSKRNRQFESRFNVIATSEIECFDKLYRLMLESIKRKSALTWQGVILLVAFDDLMSASNFDEQDECEFQNHVIRRLKHDLSEDEKKHFKSIYIVGMHGHYIHKLV